jgi:hypothetical protein
MAAFVISDAAYSNSAKVMLVKKGEVIIPIQAVEALTRRPLFTPRKITGTHFC